MYRFLSGMLSFIPIFALISCSSGVESEIGFTFDTYAAVDQEEGARDAIGPVIEKAERLQFGVFRKNGKNISPVQLTDFGEMMDEGMPVFSTNEQDDTYLLSDLACTSDKTYMYVAEVFGDCRACLR